MGVDCLIELPASVRLREAAAAVGILLGCEKIKHFLPSFSGKRGEWVARGDAWSVGAKGVKTTGSGVPECAWIEVCAPDVSRNFLWHFEFDPEGNRGMMLRSTPINIALGKALVDLFGGRLLYNDSGDMSWDYARPAKWPEWPEDDEAWQALQEAVFALEPLTKAQIAKMKRVAASWH